MHGTAGTGCVALINGYHWSNACNPMERSSSNFALATDPTTVYLKIPLPPNAHKCVHCNQAWLLYRQAETIRFLMGGANIPWRAHLWHTEIATSVYVEVVTEVATTVRKDENRITR